MSYAWSPAGLLNTLTDTEGRRTDYLYDPVGRLAEVIGPNDDSMVFRFDAGGRLVEKLLPNGGSARYAYNEDNTLHQVVNRNTASTILTQHDYAYDGVGNRLSHAEQIGGSMINYAYSYDELKRLTQVANGTASQQENYAYDPLGNRTVKSIGNPASTTYAYLYDSANQLKEIHSGSLGGSLLATLTYDANGNLTGDGTRSYTWDAINQLAQETRGATSVAYSYDSEGRRIKKVTGGQTTQWLYDGQNIYAEYGSAWTNPNAIYTQAGIDTPLIRTTLSVGSFAQAQYYHSDGLGSIVGLSNSTDNTTQTQRFDAWGTTLSGTIPQSAQYGYTGREPDETGLVYYRARYTEPTIGRFIARDPIGLQGGINSYTYGANSPTDATDPLGLWRLPDYYSITATLPALFIPGIGPFVGGGATISIDRNGTVYAGPVVGVGGPIAGGGSLTVGYLNQSGTPTPEQLSNFLTQSSFHAGGGYYVGAVESWTPGSGFSTSVGVFTLGGGLQYSYSWQLNNLTNVDQPPAPPNTAAPPSPPSGQTSTPPRIDNATTASPPANQNLTTLSPPPTPK